MNLDAYPMAFHSAVQSGGAVLYAGDLPWTPGSSARRFRQFLADLRKAGPHHPLYGMAKKRWRVQPFYSALAVTVSNYSKGETPSLSAALIDAAGV